MKISIFTTIGNERSDGFDRGDAVIEALESYHALADEIIIVNGSKPYQTFDDGTKVFKANYPLYLDDKIDSVYNLWPYDWSWEQLPKQMNIGLQECTGDWVIRADIDYIFHERDIKEIRKRLESAWNYPVATFQKYSFVLHDKYYQKGSVPIALNMGKFGDHLAFGHATNARTDLCYPIIKTGMNDKGIPEGSYNPETHYKLGLPFYNYDYTFKTIDQTKEEFHRFSKAYYNYFGEYKFGATEEKSFELFIAMMKGRLDRCVYKIGRKQDGWMRSHPKYIRPAIDALTKDQFGYNGWGLL